MEERLEEEGEMWQIKWLRPWAGGRSLEEEQKRNFFWGVFWVCERNEIVLARELGCVRACRVGREKDYGDEN